jgi:hypothetical protein
MQAEIRQYLKSLEDSARLAKEGATVIGKENKRKVRQPSSASGSSVNSAGTRMGNKATQLSKVIGSLASTVDKLERKSSQVQMR